MFRIPRQHVLSILPLALVMMLVVVFIPGANRSPFQFMPIPMTGLAVWLWLQWPRPRLAYIGSLIAMALTLLHPTMSSITAVTKWSAERSIAEGIAIVLVFFVSTFVTLTYRWIRRYRLVDHDFRGELESGEARGSLFDLIVMATSFAAIAGVVRYSLSHTVFASDRLTFINSMFMTVVLTLMAIGWLSMVSRLSFGIALALCPLVWIAASVFEWGVIAGSNWSLAKLDDGYRFGDWELSVALVHQFALAVFAVLNVQVGLKLSGGTSSSIAAARSWGWAGKWVWAIWGLTCIGFFGFNAWHRRTHSISVVDDPYRDRTDTHLGWPQLFQVVTDNGSNPETLHWNGAALAFNLLVATIGAIVVGWLVPWVYVRMAASVQVAKTESARRSQQAIAMGYLLLAFVVVPGGIIGTAMHRIHHWDQSSDLARMLSGRYRSNFSRSLGSFAFEDVELSILDRMLKETKDFFDDSFEKNSWVSLTHADLSKAMDRKHPRFAETMSSIFAQQQLRYLTCEDATLLTGEHMAALASSQSLQQIHLGGSLPSESLVDELLSVATLQDLSVEQPLTSTRAIARSRLVALTATLDRSAPAIDLPKTLGRLNLRVENPTIPIELRDLPELTTVQLRVPSTANSVVISGNPMLNLVDIGGEVDSVKITACPSLKSVGLDGASQLRLGKTDQPIDLWIAHDWSTEADTTRPTNDALLQSLDPDAVGSLTLHRSTVSRDTLSTCFGWNELRSLDLSGCFFEEDAFLATQSIRRDHTMTSLRIGQRPFDQTGLDALLAAFPNLTNFAVVCPDVRSLDLRNTPELTRILLEECPRLDTLRWKGAFPRQLILGDNQHPYDDGYSVAGSGFNREAIVAMLKPTTSWIRWTGEQVDPAVWSNLDLSELESLEFSNALVPSDAIRTWVFKPKYREPLDLAMHGGDAKLPEGLVLNLLRSIPDVEINLSRKPATEDRTRYFNKQLDLGGRIIDASIVDELKRAMESRRLETDNENGTGAQARSLSVINLEGCHVDPAVLSRLAELPGYYFIADDLAPD